MGLFSFVKDAGAKLFGKKTSKEIAAEKKAADAAADAKARQESEDRSMANALKAVVSGLGFEIEALHISVNDDAVTVSGTAPTDEIREKVILSIGNVEGIASVDDQMEVELVSRNVTAANSQFHTVERGDSLSKIAKKYYGNAMKYPVIFEANKPMLEHPDKIYPGQVLRIPSAEA
jgi:nucleoid-associated protein YgaU